MNLLVALLAIAQFAPPPHSPYATSCTADPADSGEQSWDVVCPATLGLATLRSRPFTATTSGDLQQYVGSPCTIAGDGWHDGKRCEQEVLTFYERAENENSNPELNPNEHGADLWLARTCDGGLTWFPPVRLMDTPTDRDMWCAASRDPLTGDLILTWNQFHTFEPPPYNLFRRLLFMRSDDEFATIPPIEEGPRVGTLYNGMSGAPLIFDYDHDPPRVGWPFHFRPTSTFAVGIAIAWSYDAGHTWGMFGVDWPQSGPGSWPPPPELITIFSSAWDGVGGLDRQFQQPHCLELCGGEKWCLYHYAAQLVSSVSQKRDRLYGVRAATWDALASAPAEDLGATKMRPAAVQLGHGMPVGGVCGPIVILSARDRASEWNANKIVTRGYFDLSYDGGHTLAAGAEFDLAGFGYIKQASLFEIAPFVLAVSYAQTHKETSSKSFVEVLYTPWPLPSIGAP